MAVDALPIEQLPELPPPGPSQLEIRFRRLLHQCAARAQRERASDAPGAAAPWQADAKFHCVSPGARQACVQRAAAGGSCGRGARRQRRREPAAPRRQQRRGGSQTCFTKTPSAISFPAPAPL